MESSHLANFNILNWKILFRKLFNMNMLCDFVTIVFNHMFKVVISEIHWNIGKGHTTYKIGCK